MTEELAWTGTFEQKTFPDLLLEVKDLGKTGILLAKEGKIEKRIFFQNGEPVASRSNIRNDLLGEILCRRDKISRAQLDETILESQTQKNSNDNFGQILIKKGFLTPKALYSECKYQFVSIFFTLFAWQEGNYAFQEQEASTLIPQDLPRFRVKFTKLFSEGVRLIKDQGFIDRILGSPDLRMSPTDLDIPSEDLSFRGDEKPVLDALAEGKTIEEILSSLTLDPFLAKKILYTLSALGVVEIQAPVSEEEKETAESREEEEELPAVSEESLSAFMYELMPEEESQDAGASEEEAPALFDADVMPNEEQNDGLLPPQMETEEELEDISEKIQFAVDEAKDALEEAPASTEEEEAPAAPEEQTAPDEAAQEEETVVDMEDIEEPEVEEEPRPEDAASKADKEEALPPEQEEVLEQAVGKEAEMAAAVPEEKPKEKEKTPQKKKRPVLLLVSVVMGAVLIFGGMALFYFMKARELKTIVVAEIEKDPAVAETIEVKKPSEIMQKLLEEDIPPKEAESKPAGNEKKIETSEPEESAVPETAPPAADKETAEAEKPAAVQEPSRPVEEKAITEEVSPPPKEEPAPQKTAPPWNGFYAKGLAGFQERNLKSAFQEWSDVIRSAPGSAYSIQVEITSNLDYAVRDIKEASPEEKVFIVETFFNEKPAYKVLCGIYDSLPEAKIALKNLSPYLKAQKPMLTRLDRLKTKLPD